MFPVLFETPEVPAWVAALLVALLGGVFVWFGRRNPDDKGSLWLGLACLAGAGVVLLKFGFEAKLGRWPIRTFGLLVVAGFLIGTKVMAWRNRARRLLTGEETFDLSFYMLLAGLAGARLLHVVQNSKDFEGKPWRTLYLWDGGLVWYGGAVAGTFFAWWWLAKRGKDLWSVSDSLALAVPVGHAIGRLGCFAAGCDYGTIVPGGRDAIPWAVHFPNPTLGKPDYCLVPPDHRYDAENDLDVYVHPTQLYLAAANLLMFLVLWIVDRKAVKGAFPGRLAAMYLLLYSATRFTIEYWRGDADRGVYFGGSVSFSQIASVLVFAAGAMLYNFLRQRPRPVTAA